MESRPPAGHRVILVRQWAGQMAGSGCCGRIGDDVIETITGQKPDDDLYTHCDRDAERVGAVYRALRARFEPDELTIEVVDPRNTAWLPFAVWRDARRRGSPWRIALREATTANAPCALICDGRLLATDPDPDEAVAAVESDLTERSPTPAP